MINKLQVRHLKTQSTRKRVNTEQYRTQNTKKCFIIHHLGEPKMSPLHLQRMKKINRRRKREVSPIALVDNSFSVKAAQQSDRNSWRRTYMYHFGNHSKKNKTQTSRNQMKTNNFKTISQQELNKLKNIIRKTTQFQFQSPKQSQKQYSPFFEKSIFQNFTTRQDLRRQLESRTGISRDFKIIKKEPQFRQTLNQKNHLTLKTWEGVRLLQQRTQNSNPEKKIQKQIVKKSAFANQNLTGWVIDNDFQ